MQRSNDQNPNGQNNNNSSGYNNNNRSAINNDNINDNDRIATSSYQNLQANASAMRSNLQNPRGTNYEVAGPTIGGSPSPYDPDNIEMAKDNLVDSMSGTHISDAGLSSTQMGKSSLTSNVASTAAGTAALNAPKKMVSHEDSAQDTSFSSPHPHQLATMDMGSQNATKSTTYATDNLNNLNNNLNNNNYNNIDNINTSTIHPISSATTPPSASTTSTSIGRGAGIGAGVTAMGAGAAAIKSQLSAAPSSTTTTAYSTPSATANLSSSKVEPLHSTGLNESHMLHSMKGQQVNSAAVMGATSATIPAPPMNDTVMSTTDLPPTAPGQTTPKIHRIDSDTPAVMKPEYKDHENVAEHKEHLGLGDKIKNVFRRRSSATEMDAETGNFQAAHTPGASNVLHSDRAKTAAAATAAYVANKKVSNKAPATESPYLTSSGAPKADLHATTGKPAAKVDIRPTSTLNQGYNNRSEKVTTATTSTAAPVGTTIETASTKPLTQKIVGNKDTVSNLSSGTPSSISSGATMDSTAAIYTPSVNESTRPITAQSTTSSIPSATPVNRSTAPNVDSVLEKTVVTEYAPGPAPHASRPLAEKITKPMMGAASAVGAAAAGTAAYLGRRASDAKDAVKHATHHDSSSKANVKTTSNTTTTTAPQAEVKTTSTTYNAPMASTTSTQPLISKISAPVAGSGAAIGAATIGTASSIGNKLSATKDSTTSYQTPQVNTTYQTPQVNTNSTTYATPAVSTASTQPLGSKIAAPVVGAAATGTAAYMGNKASVAKDSGKDSMSNLTSSTPSASTTSYQTSHQTPQVNTTYQTPQVNTTYQTPQMNTTSTTYTTPAVNTASTQPLGSKITAPVVGTASALGAAATGTAAYLGNKAPVAKDSVKDSIPYQTSQLNTTYQTPQVSTTYQTPKVNTASTTYTTPAVSTASTQPLGSKIAAPVVGTPSALGAAATGTAAYLGNKASATKDTVTNTTSYPTTQSSAPVNVMGTKTAPTSAATGPISNQTTASADRMAAIPAAYHGPIPTAGPGEEVVWVKTVTTTDIYDEDASVPGSKAHSDVIESHQETLNPSSYGTAHDNERVINNTHQQQGNQRQSKGHM